MCLEIKPWTRHHVIPRSHGGAGTTTQSVCADCHALLHSIFTNEHMAKVSWKNQQIAARFRLDPNRTAWTQTQARKIAKAEHIAARPLSKAQKDKLAMKQVASNWRAFARNPEDEALRIWKEKHEEEIVKIIMEKRATRGPYA